MKRFLGIACALFFAVVAIALTGADSSAVAGHHGCHGRTRCHGRVHRCNRRGLCHRRHRCHGQAAACESCSSCESGCAGGDCSGDAVIEEGTPTEAAPEAPAAPKKKNKKKEKAA